MVDNADRFCCEMLPKTLSAEDRARLAGHKAALLSAVKWTPGQTITVSFLEGDPGLRERVEKVAREWTKLANLQLAFVDKAQIRIAFMPGKGSWSYLGKDCERIPEPPGGTLDPTTLPKYVTMNYGWLTPQSDDDEVRRVVLHEFGHARSDRRA